MSPNFCRFSHVCSVASLLLVHTFQRLYLGKEGSRHSCSPLHMTDGCLGLFLTCPFLTLFPVLLLSFPYKYRLSQLCSAGAGDQVFFLLSLKYHAILSFLAWPSANSFFIYLVYEYVVDTGKPHSGDWNKGYALVPMTLYVPSDLNIAKASTQFALVKFQRKKKNHPEILRLMKSPKFIQW